jgi:hypothetical protein
VEVHPVEEMAVEVPRPPLPVGQLPMAHFLTAPAPMVLALLVVMAPSLVHQELPVEPQTTHSLQ